MKRIFALLTALMLLCPLTACDQPEVSSVPDSSEPAQEESVSESEPSSSLPDVSQPETDEEESRVLVAYFSATGNTENIALHLRDILDADLYCKTVRRVQVRRRTDGAAERLFLRRRAKMCGITAGKSAIAMAIRNISGWMR